MKESKDLTVKKYKQSGFTLIEMLIVIIILGILAMIIIPQITVSTDDAKVSTLKANLTSMRSAIEVYYAQHNMTYPGVKVAGTNVAGSAAAFIAQLTQFTDVDGGISGTKTGNFIHGPYIKGGALPANPFITDTTKNNLVSIAATADVTAPRALLDGSVNGWAYLPAIGVFYANDNVTATPAHISY